MPGEPGRRSGLRLAAGPLRLAGWAVVTAALALALVSAELASTGETGAALDALFPEGRTTVPLAQLIEREPLRPDESVRVELLGRDANTSHHLVRLRDAEEPHRHDRHDLWVVILRGHGSMLLGDTRRSVGEGSVLYVPRGTTHAFANTSGAPAAALAVYTPPFDGRDRVPVPDPDPAPDGPDPNVE